MTRFDAVLFDMDGVLLEGASTPASVYRRAAGDAIEALELAVPDDQRASLEQYHFDQEMAACCRGLGVDPAAFWQTREHFATERATHRLATGEREPFADTAALADLSVPLGIVSNNRAATVDFVAERLFSGRFDIAIGRDPTVTGFERRKPDSHYLDRALDSLGTDRAVYVGDRETDVLAARAAGIESAFLRRAHNDGVTFDQPPALDIESLRALPSMLEVP